MEWLELNNNEKMEIIETKVFSYLTEGKKCDVSNEWFLNKLDSFYKNSEYDGVIEPNEVIDIFAKVINVFCGKPIADKFSNLLNELKPKELLIWKYCQDLLEEHDKTEGKYTGDKYINLVFSQIAERFDMNIEEIKHIWLKGDGVTAGVKN